MATRILTGDALTMLRAMPDASVHMAVTSPPYWGLRDYGVAGQLGSEPTPDEYVANLVAVFREVRRVLRDDGTLWLNLGDTYAEGKCGRADSGDAGRFGGPELPPTQRKPPPGLKPKDLVGIPWRVAFALQSDGWFLRQDIIWHKPNPMPESVRDRCTKAHEYLFLLSKSPRYFYDVEAIREGCVTSGHGGVSNKAASKRRGTGLESDRDYTPDGRRIRRSVWTVSTRPYKGAHFATFPPDLIRPAILAGTSAAGCCAACGAPHVRMTERTRVATRPARESKVHDADAERGESCETPLHQVVGNRDPLRHVTTTRTTGFRASCDCVTPPDVVPCRVLDPFGGAGTTALVANQEGRDAVLIELNPSYVELAESRLASMPQGNAERRRAYIRERYAAARELYRRRRAAVARVLELATHYAGRKVRRGEFRDANCVRSVEFYDAIVGTIATEFRDLFPATGLLIIDHDATAETLLSWLRDGVPPAPSRKDVAAQVEDEEQTAAESEAAA